MAKLSDPRENNFNLLRLIAAVSVIFSHSYDVAGNENEYFYNLIGYRGGWISVSAFFSISGFLIYSSIIRSGSIREFLVARSLRIFPGLWVMLVITTIGLGLFASSQSIPSFFSNSETLLYILGNGALFFPRYYLPGVFDNLPLAGVINGSLWTLRFEFACYIAVLLLFLAGAFKNERRFIIFFSIYVSYYVIHLLISIKTGHEHAILHDGNNIGKFYRLFFAFFLGILAARYVNQIQVRFWAVILAFFICWLTWGTIFFMTSLIIFIGAAFFWLAFLRSNYLIPFRSMHDYSYGIYVYAFPVQQVCQMLFPDNSTTWNSIMSLTITVPLAAMSWHFIESPCLRMKSIFIKKADAK